jgi:branched-chain amino acid transport system substrate-binding protein
MGPLKCTIGSLSAMMAIAVMVMPVAVNAQPAPIKVGVILPLTGIPAVSGTTNQAGMLLYLDSIGNAVDGHPLNVIFADDQGGAADVGLTKVRQLVESDGVQVLMGGVTSAVCYAIAPYVKQVRIPMLVTGNCAAQGLTIDPKYTSPYIIRLTHNSSSIAGPAAAWAYRAGLRKGVIFTSDFSAGIEIADLFASAFVGRGGTIVQEMHPPRGTNDFGPFFSQLDPNADFMAVMLAGGELSFVEQLSNYVRAHKIKVLDLYGQVTNGEFLPQHGDKAIGLLAVSPYTPGIDTKENKAFLAAWSAKFPGRVPTLEAALGYSAAEVLVGALHKVKGNLEGEVQQKSFLEALYQTNVITPRGPIKLDAYHDVVQNMYVYEVIATQSGQAPTTRVIETIPNVSQHWDRTPTQLSSFAYGRLKGTWVGQTKEKLGDVITPRN